MQNVIPEYLRAYKAANPENPAPIISYERGWFVFRNPFPSRYRRRQIEEMTAALKARLLSKGAPQP